MYENKGWDIESKYKKNNGALIKIESMQLPKLFDLNLGLRLKRSDAYYRFVTTAARSKIMGAAVAVLIIIVVIALIIATPYFMDAENAKGKILTAIYGGVGICVGGLVAQNIYNQKKLLANRRNLSVVCNQNAETLKAFFADFMQEKTLIDALGFRVGDNITIQSFEAEPMFQAYPHQDYRISLIGLLESGTKTAELSVTLAFEDGYTTLKVCDYTAKKMID